MIAPPANTRIWIAAGVTDLRRGFMGLSALVQTKLSRVRCPVTCLSFAAVEAISLNSSGSMVTHSVCKRLERGRFIWPQVTSGTVSLTPAQLSMLLEGIDWRRPERTWDPHVAV